MTHPVADREDRVSVFNLPLDFLTRFDNKAVVAKWKDFASDIYEKSTEVHCEIFDSPVTFDIQLGPSGFVIIKIICSSSFLGFALKKDILSLRLQVTKEMKQAGLVPIPKNLSAYAHELMDDLSSIENENTEEGRAMIEQIYQRLRTNLSAKLP